MADPRLEPRYCQKYTVEDWVKGHSTAQGLALRARIVLGCAEDRSNLALAARLGIDRRTFATWRTRFLARMA
jgi:hypothetical protein